VAEFVGYSWGFLERDGQTLGGNEGQGGAGGEAVEETLSLEQEKENASATEEARVRSEEEANVRAEEEAKARAEETERVEEEAKVSAEEEAARADEEAEVRAEEEARAAEDARVSAEEAARADAEARVAQTRREHQQYKTEMAEKLAAVKAAREQSEKDLGRLRAAEREAAVRASPLLPSSPPANIAVHLHNPTPDLHHRSAAYARERAGAHAVKERQRNSEAFFWAVADRDMERTRWFLHQDCDVNYVPAGQRSGETALHLVVCQASHGLGLGAEQASQVHRAALPVTLSPALDSPS
jgi:hypothetical protein